MIEYIKLNKFFSRDERVTGAPLKRRKKILKLIIMNKLLNCIRKYYRKQSVKFEDEFVLDQPETITNFIDLNDKCWAVKNFMAYNNYNVSNKTNNTVLAARKLKQDLKGKYPKLLINEAINKSINKTYPDVYSYIIIKDFVIAELDKLKLPKPDKKVSLPTGVSSELFSKYFKTIKNDFNGVDEEQLRLSVSRFILNKHNKMKISEIDKTLNIIDKKLATAVKKKLTETLKK